MLKKRLKCLIPFLFLIPGLISCSKDKGTTPDAFNATGFVVKNADRSYHFDKDIQSLPINGELTVSSLAKVDFQRDPIHFTITSQCKNLTTKNIFHKEYHQENSATFPVIALIPADILLSTENAQIFCDFNLLAESFNTSKSTALLNGVEIKGLAGFSNFKPDSLVDDQLIYSGRSNDLVSNAEGATVHLNCTDFAAKKVLRGETVNWQSLIEPSLNERRISRSQQICRLLIDNKADQQLTSSFQLYMPMQAPILTTTLPDRMNYFSETRERQILRTQIYNPNTTPLVIQVRDLDKSTYLFQPLFSGGRANVFKSRVYERHLRLEIRTNTQRNSAGEIEFVVPPQSEITIDGFSNVGIICGHQAYYKDSGYSLIGQLFSINQLTQFLIYNSEGKLESLAVPTPNENHFQAPNSFSNIELLQPEVWTKELVSTRIYHDIILSAIFCSEI